MNKNLKTYELIGWVLTLVVPIVVYAYLMGNDVGENKAIFIAIVAMVINMWCFSLAPTFIAPLFALLLILLSGVVPANVAMAGFASNTIMITFSVFGISCLVQSSGLSRRYTLWLIRVLPRHTLAYHLSLFVTGVLFTPIIPSVLGRTSMVAPVLGEMRQRIDSGTGTGMSTMLYAGGLDSLTFMSAFFLTGAPANLFIYGLLPGQDQQAFQFLHWLWAGSLCMVIMGIGYFILTVLLFGRYQPVGVDKEGARFALEELGPMTWREGLALFSILFLAVGVATISIHNLNIAVIALVVFFCLLFLGVVTPSDFKEKINWTFIFMLASIIGIVAAMKYLEVDKDLVSNLQWLADSMLEDFAKFVFLLICMVLAARFFLPMGTTNFIFATALFPLAIAGGINPWAVGFIILVISETSFFDYQSPHIQLYKERCGGRVHMMNRRLVMFHALLLIVKVAGIYCSILFFWNKLGIV